jgi:cytochrome oxidase Cu insertion factor (SCO1/SenC/PrrC family)
MSRVVLFWIALLFFVAGSTLLWLGFKNVNRMTAGGTSEPAPLTQVIAPKGQEDKWLKEYELTERSGKKRGSEDLAGQIHLVSFFFASCPASCRTQNQHFADLEREFGKQGVKFVAITCDPENDTPERLREYAQLYNAPEDSWYFLTGDLLYTRRIAGEVYGVALDRKSHVERFILVDQNGKIRGHYSWADPAKLNELRADLRMLLKNQDAQTANEVRETKKRAERLKEIEDEEAEEPTASGEPSDTTEVVDAAK